MARTANIGTDIWSERTITALTVSEQHAYLLLDTQSDLTRCGVLPYRLGRWASLTHGLTEPALRKTLHALEKKNHIAIDETYGELFVRTYVRHDGLLTQPFMVATMCRDFQLVGSPKIRLAFLTEIRRLAHLTELPAGEREGVRLAITGQSPKEPVRTALAKSVPLAEDISAHIHEGTLPGFDEPIATAYGEPFSQPLQDGSPRGFLLSLSPSPFPHPPRGSTDPKPENGTKTKTLCRHCRQALHEPTKVELAHATDRDRDAAWWTNNGPECREAPGTGAQPHTPLIGAVEVTHVG